MPLPPYPVDVPPIEPPPQPVSDAHLPTIVSPDPATPTHAGASPPQAGASPSPRIPEWVGIVTMFLAVLLAIGIGLLRPRAVAPPVAAVDSIPVASATATVVALPAGYEPLPAALMGGWTPPARDLPLNAGWPYRYLNMREGDHCMIAYITDPATPEDQVAHLWVDCTAIGEPAATPTPIPPTPVPSVPPPVVPVAPVAICKEVVLDSVVIGTACGRTQEELLADAQLTVEIYTAMQASQAGVYVTPTMPVLTTEQYEELIYGPQRATATAAALQRATPTRP